MTSPYTQIMALIPQVTSEGDLRALSQELNRQFRTIQPKATEAGFKRGQHVSFNGHGERIHATVEKVNQKTITVQPGGHVLDGACWRVAPSLLTKEEGPCPRRQGQRPAVDRHVVVTKHGVASDVPSDVELEVD